MLTKEENLINLAISGDLEGQWLNSCKNIVDLVMGIVTEKKKFHQS